MTRRTTNGIRRTSGGVGRTTPLQTTTVIDDFERGNLDPYSGDLSAWSITTNAIQGTYAVECSTNVTGIRSYPGDGLNYYPQRGDKFRLRLQFEGQNAYSMNFGLQDNSNFYGFRVDNDENEARLSKRVDGTDTVLASTTGVNNLGVGWLDKVEVTWATDGTLRLVVVDDDGTTQADISATDSTFDSGAINLFYISKGNTAQPIRVDEILKSGDA